MPNILCIDEFYFKVAKGIKYPCVITGFHPFKIIDVIRSRQMSQLTHYFGNIMPSERNRVKYFVSDMNDTYRDIKALFFPKSIHIIDTFHVVLLFTNALNMIRKRIMKKYNVKSYEYYFLKTNWKSILMNSNKLSKKEKVDSKTGEVYTFKERFFNDLMIFPELYEAYMIKDDFLYYEKKSEVKKVMNMINIFVERCRNASSEEMRKCGESLNKWSNEIANGFIKNEYNLNITNAKAERMNRTIGDILRNAFGYKSFDRLRKRVLYIEREKSKK